MRTPPDDRPLALTPGAGPLSEGPEGRPTSPVLELVICTYNNADMLAGALAAIAAQRVSEAQAWGVLVVNNNCTDHTVAVVAQAQQTGNIPHLRMVTETRQGLTPARLCGVQHTTAPWIAFVDDDCFLQPDWVAHALEFAAQHPTCGAFGGRVTLAWETPPPAYVLNFTYAFAEQELGPEAKPVSWLVGAGMVINRAALVAVGWTERQLLADRVGKQLVSGGDMEIALRLAARYELWYTPHCQLLHQIPRQRTQDDYLLKINYGLGGSQLFVSSLQWGRSYPAWVWASLREAWRQTAYYSKRWLKAAIAQESTREATISLCFWWGYWVGIGRLFTLNPQKRQQLLGSAKPPC